MANQKSIGAWVMGLGQLLLVLMLVLCVVDMAGLQARGGLMLPLAVYLGCIFTGVAMQFIGSAIPHMKFTQAK